MYVVGALDAMGAQFRYNQLPFLSPTEKAIFGKQVIADNRLETLRQKIGLQNRDQHIVPTANQSKSDGALPNQT